MERTNENKLCLRKVMGALCIICGILIMLVKLCYFMLYQISIPYEGRGQFLVGTGVTLLGITSVDHLIDRLGGNTKNKNSDDSDE